jgi:hypothetical protein
MSLTNVLPTAGTEAVEADTRKDRSFSYVSAFAALGIFATIIGLLLNLDVASF